MSKRNRRRHQAPAQPTPPQPAQPLQGLSPAAALEVARVLQASPAAYPQFTPVGQRPQIYAYDHPIYYTVPGPPQRRPGQALTVDTLRRVADAYDILRSCINHLKREVAATPIEIVSKEKDKSEATKKRIQEATRLFSKSGGIGGPGRRRSHFESEVLEDAMVVGAAAVHFHPNRGGGLYQVVAVDAATIRPRVDAYGWPGPGEIVYEQWIEGLYVGGFTREELSYDGLWPVSYSPYFKSPTEWLISTISAALRSDDWNLSWLTDGTTVDDKVALPEGWTPAQIREYAEWWDSLLAGNSSGRQKTKFVPGGSQKVGTTNRKDNDFQEFMLWLMRRTCSVMGVSPASIGFAGEQYKVSQENSQESTTAFGAGALLDFRKETYDEILERAGYEDLECRNVVAREEKAKERAERNEILIRSGQKTPNEARADEGLDPDADGDVLLVQNTMVPLEQAVREPEPVDPAGAPAAPGAPATSGGGIPKAKPADSVKRAYRQWERKSLNRLRQGKPAACAFESELIPAETAGRIERCLSACTTVDQVRAVFELVPGE